MSDKEDTVEDTCGLKALKDLRGKSKRKVTRLIGKLTSSL